MSLVELAIQVSMRLSSSPASRASNSIQGQERYKEKGNWEKSSRDEMIQA